jgi:hypothetical protein
MFYSKEEEFVMKNIKRTKFNGLTMRLEEDGLPIGKFHVGNFEKLEKVFFELKKKYR